ncbi:Hypothetical predicted protein [Mytilus galloprovincialis]|uniref:B box-type domain-containing protein n=1 Tax=Mytilus galloprovincialis TaxID=29158 RepID=A0A8B6F9L4_MYTGA|nr:Hypothetical predicted protein [Mytilus galloprovincialis]
MASSKPIPCGPCIEGKVNTKADIWCYNCDEGLCSTCSGHHKRSKLSRDHKIIDIKNYKPSVQAIRTECDKHGQQLNLYCPSHLMPCCDECISISHSKCTGIKSLASIVEKTKIEKSKESIEKDINSILQLLGIHQIEQQVHQCQRYIDDLEKDDRAKEFTIKMEKNNEVEKMIKKFGSLGELTVVKTDMDLKKETSVRREAQVESQEQSNINNMTINIEKKIKINIRKTISDMICLMDGRLIIVEWGQS